ncbi:hypothetical protein E4U53_006442 [Claviceps sorghi]|nr:hypothetical protein E4U53_006442 [Claviceps sorghi]
MTSRSFKGNMAREKPERARLPAMLRTAFEIQRADDVFHHDKGIFQNIPPAARL